MLNFLPERTAPIVVSAPCGRLAGSRENGVSAFKGIPFAKPPIGPLRWHPPEPLVPWAGVRDATRFGCIGVQAPTQIEAVIGAIVGEQSENCLSLNIWTPNADDAKRSVMVWVHGGAFVFGAGSQGIYNGRNLAQRGDVVVVTMNYRLGAFGFLNLSDATDGRAPGCGTEGLADQILALKWVKENIASFGGNPEDVTLFGESAGAMSVACVLSMPSVRGLFRKAIIQSGPAHVGYEREKSARVARALLDELGISPKEAHKAAQAPYAAVVNAQLRVLADSRDGEDTRKLGRMPFQPCIDCALLPERPIVPIRNGAAKDIPVLTGTTREEWKLFTAMHPGLRLMNTVNLERRLLKSFGPEKAKAMLAAYEEGSPFDRWNAIMTDRVFSIPAIRLLEAQGRHAPVFAYRFDWKSKLMGGIFGSCHALDIGYVFGTPRLRGAAKFFGAGPEADALSAAIMDSWIAFARTGNPSCKQSGEWLRYDSDSRQTIILGDGPPHLLHAPDDARRAVWDGVPDALLGT
ncbi:MAG: carboxylesterase/lipase family protein [Alphaproteobacteria bacterium]